MAGAAQPDTPFSFIKYATDLASEAGHERAVRLDFPREPHPGFFLNATQVVPIASQLDAEPEGPFRIPEVVNRASLTWIVSKGDRVGHLILSELDSDGKEHHLDLGPMPEHLIGSAQEAIEQDLDFCRFYKRFLEVQVVDIPLVESGETTPWPSKVQPVLEMPVDPRFSRTTLATLLDDLYVAGLEGLVTEQDVPEWNAREDVRNNWATESFLVTDGDQTGRLFIGYEPQTIMTMNRIFVINTHLQLDHLEGDEISLPVLVTYAVRSRDAERAAEVAAAGQPIGVIDENGIIQRTPIASEAAWYMAEAARRAANPDPRPAQRVHQPNATVWYPE